jgi:hypothetical protein
MKGIPAELHYEVLTKTIEKMPTPDSLVFTNMFSRTQYESDRIRWAIEYGTAGMTPFVAPGAPAPTMGDEAMYSEGSAAAAYWKEKNFIDETRLNNLREALTASQRQTAERQIARQQRRLRTRCDRRREWMIAKAFFDHQITYQREGGTKFTVNYGVPDHHKPTLIGDDRWDTGDGTAGATATPIQDIFDWKKMFKEDVGVEPTDFFINSEMLKTLMFMSDLQDLLKKSNFGNGDLFTNPAPVIGQLLGLGSNLQVYDDLFEVSAWLTSDVTIGTDSTVTISVDDATDFEANQKVRMYDLRKPFQYVDYTIDSVDVPNNQIDVTSTTDHDSHTFQSGATKVTMRKKFITDDKIGFFARQVDGEDIAEFMEAPFGNDRHFGMFADSKEEWDPEGIWMRIQNKGLPVIYHPDAIFTATVK